MVAPCVGKVPGTGLEVSLLTINNHSSDVEVLTDVCWGLISEEAEGTSQPFMCCSLPGHGGSGPTCVAGFPSWGSCVMFWQGWLMLGLAGNSHFPVWRQGDRLVIYSYFWYSCAERDSSLHMETCSFSPGMGAEFALWHSWCSSTFLSLLCLIAACLTGNLL